MPSSKRTILITGCSDGSLGAALALAFHKAGWRVFASARNPKKLEEVTKAGIETIQLDVLSQESIDSSVAKVTELTGGSLDALLNNAGAGYNMPVTDMDIDKAKELFELNVWSVVRMSRAYVPLLLKAAPNALLINNTSGVSLPVATFPFQGAYNASKAAEASFTETLRHELGPFGIKVINIITGAVKSGFFGNVPKPGLPANSMYNVAKDVVEKYMSERDDWKASDRMVYAQSVVKDVDRKNPPHWVWRGAMATQARLGALLPIGWLDGMVKGMTGLDVLEKRLKEQNEAKSK